MVPPKGCCYLPIQQHIMTILWWWLGHQGKDAEAKLSSTMLSTPFWYHFWCNTGKYCKKEQRTPNVRNIGVQTCYNYQKNFTFHKCHISAFRKQCHNLIHCSHSQSLVHNISLVFRKTHCALTSKILITEVWQNVIIQGILRRQCTTDIMRDTSLATSIQDNLDKLTSAKSTIRDFH